MATVCLLPAMSLSDCPYLESMPYFPLIVKRCEAKGLIFNTWMIANSANRGYAHHSVIYQNACRKEVKK